MKLNNAKKEFAPSTIFNLTKKGNGSSVTVNAKLYDMLQSIKMGDRLYLEALNEEIVGKLKAKSQFPDSTPTHKLSVLSGEQRANRPSTNTRTTRVQDDI